MYLGLFGYSFSSDVRFIGALRLALQIPMLNFKSNEFHPCDTVLARHYYERIRKMRLLQTNAKLLSWYSNLENLRADSDSDSDAAQMQGGPYALFADSVLQLGSDADTDVCRLGKIAWGSIPAWVQQQALWCPCLHASFDRYHRDMVMSMLINRIL